MSYEEKLKKEKRKKQLIALGIIGAMGVGGGIFYFVLHTKSNKIDMSKIKDNTLVNFIITATNDGNVKLINPFNKKEVAKLKLPKGNYTFAIANNYEYMLAVNTDTSKVYKLEENDKDLKQTELLTLSNTEPKNIVSMKTDNNYLYIMHSDNKLISVIQLDNGNVKTVELPKDVTAWDIKDNKVIYSNGDNINSINVGDNAKKSINVGDKTTGITVGNNKVLVFNKFGSGLNTSVAFKIDSSNLKIDDFAKFESANVFKINADSDNKSFMALIDDDGNQTLERVSLDGDNKMLSQIPLENKIILDKNAVGIKNYLYNKQDNKLNIISGDTGITTYSIDIGDSEYMPVSK